MACLYEYPRNGPAGIVEYSLDGMEHIFVHGGLLAR